MNMSNHITSSGSPGKVAIVPPLKSTSIVPETLVKNIDVDDHPLLANLKLDGREEGAYMICKLADDVLGHRARQIFREKASSMKGQNGIYYYLKDLMRRFGPNDVATKKEVHGNTLKLEEHQFKKLMASDPAFECLVAQEDITILFQRIAKSSTKTEISLRDFVEFCLLDRKQL